MKASLKGMFFTIFCLFASSDSFADQWTRHFVESNDGTRIAYYLYGDAAAKQPPLLMISGGPGSDHRYMRVGGSFERLAENRMVISFDQRGTSHSGEVQGKPHLAQWAEDVEAVRIAVGADKLDLLGHSFGGIVAMAYAQTYRPHVRTITFVNSTAATIAGTKNIMAEVFPDRIEVWREARKNLKPRFPARDINVFTSMEFVDIEKGTEFMRMIENYIYNIEVNNELRTDMAPLDYSAMLAEVKFPVLVVHGRYDPVITPQTAWELHQLIPGSEIRIIEACGHLPFVEKPGEFVKVVDDFLLKQ